MSLGSLPAGKMSQITVEGENVLLVNVDGKVYAVSSICTHEDADLYLGSLSGNNIVCPLHSSEFDIRTGEVQRPPAMEPLRTFRVEVRDGFIFVEV